jgi:hypothetical protein
VYINDYTNISLQEELAGLQALVETNFSKTRARGAAAGSVV